MVQQLSGEAGGPSGFLLSSEEWHAVTDPLNLDGRDIDDVWLALAGRMRESYNVAHVVRELIDAGAGGQSIPIRDLPEQIRKLGEARHAAEHHAKQLAGEVADLTTRMDFTLPGVVATIVRDLASDLYQNREPGNIEAEDIEDVACSALSIALRLLDVYDIRDRDQARPVEHDPAARRFTITLGADPTTTFTPAGRSRVANAEPVVWHDRPDLRLWGVTVDDAHPVVVYLTEHLGTLKGCSGSPECRRALIANTLRDAAEDVRVPVTLSGAPHDDWIHRSAERLADITLTLGTPATGLAALSRLIRDAVTHASRVIERAKPCTICDGYGGRNGTHRFGCPNATAAGTTTL